MELESTRARENWAEILQMIEDLWPNRARKEMTAELVKLWKDRLGGFEKLTVIGALKEHAASMQFYPRLTQLVISCKKRSDNDSNLDANQLSKDMLLMNQIRKESIKEMEILTHGLTSDELENYKQIEIKENPLMTWMGQKPADSFAWKMIIAQGIKKNIGNRDS